MSKENFYKIKEYLQQCNPEAELSLSECKVIAPLLDRNNITQIIYSFEIKTVLCLLNMYEEQENYSKCAIIHKKIKTHNKIHNTEYEYHL